MCASTTRLGAHANRGWKGRGAAWHPCLFSVTFTALLIKKDLGMIRGVNLAEMLGGGRKRLLSN